MRKETIVIERTITAIEMSDRNGVVQPDVGLLIRGGLPAGFTPVIIRKKCDGILHRRTDSREI